MDWGFYSVQLTGIGLEFHCGQLTWTRLRILLWTADYKWAWDFIVDS